MGAIRSDKRLGEREFPASNRGSRWRSLETRVSLLVLALFLASAAAISFAFNHVLEKDTEGMLGEQQRATVAIVAEDINRELKDRFDALNALAAHLAPTLARQPNRLQTALENHMVFDSIFNGGAFVTAMDGTAIASLPLSTNRLGRNFMDRDIVAAALRDGQAGMGRPVIGKTANVPLVAMAVPIRDARGLVIGALMGVTRLQDSNYLDAMTQSHYGKSGGYVLIARRHRLIVTASDKSRILQALPPVGLLPVLDQLVDGNAGTHTVVNRDGVEVLASAAPVPIADWVLIASIPTAEAFAPIRGRYQAVLLTIVLVAAVASLLTWWTLRHLLAPLFAASRALVPGTQAGSLPKPLAIARRDEIGQLLHAFNQTIQALAQREAQLQQSQTLARSIMDSVDAAIVVLDGDGVILTVNEPWARFAQEQKTQTRLTAQQAGMGANYLLAIAESVQEIPQAFASQALAGMDLVRQGKLPRFSMEFPCAAADAPRWSQMAVTALHGECAGLVISYADITERRRAADELLLAKLKADKANSAKSVFLAAASHDLRQPLAALTLYVDMLQVRAGPESRTLVERIQACCKGLSELLGNLLEMSKLDAGVVVPTRSDFPIDKFAVNLVSVHAATALSRGLSLRYRPCRLVGNTDVALFQRIVGNLLTNAIAYTRKGGVLLACRRHAGVLWMEVWDTGVGIPEGQSEYIFEDFTRLNHTPGDGNRTEGSGLGLSIVAKTAALLGLKIRLRSTPGRGSVFAVELPMGQAQVCDSAMQRALHRSGQVLRIALVEDNEQVCHALSLVLENQGHEVIAAPNGAELFRRLGPRCPDLVISDYRIGGEETGFDVIHAARAAFGKSLAALLVTGDTDPDLIQRITRQGIAIQYKPLNVDALLAFINQSAERSLA